MIGGPPVSYLPPGFNPRQTFVPPGGFASAPPGFVPASAPPAALPQTRVAIAMPPPPPARFPTGPAPKVLARAKVDEETAAPVDLPSPEQAGVARRSASDFDWSEAHRRLDEMGIVDFQIKPHGAGGFRFACLMPSGQPDRFYRIEGQGTTQGDAVRMALERAAPFKKGRG